MGAVLIVDDDASELKAVEAALAPLGREIVLAQDGETALRLLLERDFDAIVLDLLMPRMNGLEVAGLVRGRERTRALPIILLTGYDQEGLRLLPGWRDDLDAAYLLKPVDADTLREAVAGASSKCPS